MNSTRTEDFNWEMYTEGYTGSNRLIPNNLIKTSAKDKVFSREPYAQELLNIFTGHKSEVVRKDLTQGDVVKIADIYNIHGHMIDIELVGGLTVTVDLGREKKFLQVFGYTTPEEFITVIRNKEILKEFIGRGLNAYVIEATPSVKISLWQGHLKSVRDEFMEEIKNPSKAYTAKIVEANKGGFFVEVQGIDAFMPGSLAAPNKIIDFQSYIGKEIIVMVEDFLKEMNSFIVSHKKYLTHILPSKIQELDLSKQYEGVVTGCSKYGIFVEFGEIFTALLHVSKMATDIKAMFNERQVLAGDIIKFYISEITRDNRIILTTESPEEKLHKIQTFILSTKDKVIEASIGAIMNFGIIVNVGDINGLIPIREFKKNKIMVNNFVIGEKLNIMFDEFKDERIIFKLPAKK